VVVDVTERQGVHREDQPADHEHHREGRQPERVDSGHEPALSRQFEDVSGNQIKGIAVVLVHVVDDFGLCRRQILATGGIEPDLPGLDPMDFSESGHQMGALELYPVEIEVLESGVIPSAGMARGQSNSIAMGFSVTKSTVGAPRPMVWMVSEAASTSQPNQTSLLCEPGGIVAERIRRVIADTPVRLADGKSLRMEVSIGGCTLPVADGQTDAIALVDRALYAAKRLGRNKVVWVDGDPAVKAA